MSAKTSFKRKASLLLAIIMLFSMIPMAYAETGESGTGTGTANDLAVYYPNWGHYEDVHQKQTVADLPWEYVTTINHAFWEIVPALDKQIPGERLWEVGDPFTIRSTDPEADLETPFTADGKDVLGHFGAYEEMTKKYPNVDVLLSIGGWTRSGVFSEMASTIDNRAIFIDSCIETLEAYPWLAGIDIDWEYPGMERKADGDQGCPSSADDAVNYTALLTELRAALDTKYGTEDNRKKLTVCAPANPVAIDMNIPDPKGKQEAKDQINQELAKVAALVDRINLMTYDFTGAYDEVTGHQSNLMKSAKVNFGIDESVAFYLSQGVPVEKLNIGSALYSRGWEVDVAKLEMGKAGFDAITQAYADNADNAAAMAQLIGAAATDLNIGGIWGGGGQNPWFKLCQWEASEGFIKYYDNDAKASLLFNNNPDSKYYGFLWTYEDEQTLDDKLTWLKNSDAIKTALDTYAEEYGYADKLTDLKAAVTQGLGGLIVWETSGDKIPGSPMIARMAKALLDDTIVIPAYTPGDDELDTGVADLYNPVREWSPGLGELEIGEGIYYQGKLYRVKAKMTVAADAVFAAEDYDYVHDLPFYADLEATAPIEVGTYVIDGGLVFRKIVNNKSKSEINDRIGETAPGVWAYGHFELVGEFETTTLDLSTLRYWTVNMTPIMKGDIVVFENNLYLCIVDTYAYSSEWVPTGWNATSYMKIASIFDWDAAQSQDPFNANDYIYCCGNLFKVITSKAAKDSDHLTPSEWGWGYGHFDLVTETDYKYTVSFFGGVKGAEPSFVLSADATRAQPMTQPETLYLAGHIIDHICTDPTHTDCTPFDFENTPITESMTLYVTYTPIYNINYELDGGVPDAEAPAIHTQGVVTELKDPAKEGYDFLGWYTEAAFTNKVTELAADGYTADITLYAQWSLMQGYFEVTYNIEGDKPFTKAYKLDDEATLFDPEKAGYTFGGWYNDEALENGPVTTIPEDQATGSKEFYGKWTPVVYDITYQLNDGTNDDDNPANYTIETETITLKPATRTAYTFGGWFEDSDFTGDAVTVIEQGSIGAVTLYAKWTPVVYDITYQLNDGTNDDDNPANYTIETETITLKPATRTGYTFGGWFEDSDFTGDAVTVIEQGSTENKAFHAKWTANTYNVTYNVNGGTAIAPATYTFGTAYTLAKPADRVGYTFGGWYANANLTGNPVTAITATETDDKAFWAKWTANSYKVTYNVNGGTAIAPAGYTYGTTFTLPKPVDRVGYTFGGWYANANLTGNPVTAITATETGDKAFWAKWTQITYTVTFKDGTEVLGTVKVNHGAAATFALPTKKGYTASWDGALTNVTADRTITVKWTAMKYTIKFNKNASKAKGTMNNQKNFTFNTNKKIAANKFKYAGYTFQGWAVDSKGKVVIKAGTNVKAQLEPSKNGAIVNVYAKWAKTKAPTKKASKLKLSTTSREITVSFTKLKTASGHQVEISTSSKFTKATTQVIDFKASSKKTISKLNGKRLKKGTTYHIRVRAYNTDSTGKKFVAKAATSVKRKIKAK